MLAQIQDITIADPHTTHTTTGMTIMEVNVVIADSGMSFTLMKTSHSHARDFLSHLVREEHDAPAV